MPTKGHEGHDAGKPEGVPAHPTPKYDSEHPGYETEDVNIGGVITFVAGLCGFILIFFFFCFFMGKGISSWLQHDDGPTDKWHASVPGSMGDSGKGDQRDNLTSNAVIEQKQLGTMAQKFPGPRLETDDGNFDTAELHAKEDLLLDNYSTGGGLPEGSVRIPVTKAMELIVQRGLPKPAGEAAEKKTLMAGEQKVVVQAPLTTGFARTGYELDYIQSRNQRMESEKPEGETEKK